MEVMTFNVIFVNLLRLESLLAWWGLIFETPFKSQDAPPGLYAPGV